MREVDFKLALFLYDRFRNCSAFLEASENGRKYPYFHRVQDEFLCLVRSTQECGTVYIRLCS